MLLGPLSAAFGVMANPIPRGCIELPTAYGEHVWGLMKGRPTKYIKRVPKPGGGYRYFYDAGHGGGVHAHEHMVEGAKFAHGEGHFHIVKQDGDKLHVRNTATGEEHTITKQALAQKLAEHHAEGLKAYRDRATKALDEAKANKASPKQIARLEERVKRAGGAKTAEAAKPSAEHMDKVKTMRVSQLEWPANNPRHPMHEAAKAELERREKLVTPQQAIEIARKALAIERRQADGGEAGRRAHTSKDDDAALEAFSALTPKQKQAAMDALDNEGKKPSSKEDAKPSTQPDRSREAQREASAPKAEGKPIDHNALSKIWRSHADSTSWDRSAAKTERLYGLIKQEIARTKARPDYHGKEDMLTSLRSDLLAVGAYRKAIGSKPSGQQGADEPRPSSSATTQTRQPPSGFRPLTRESASKVDVGATLTLFNPKIGVPAKVQYRGRIGDEAHVLIDGMGMNVPLEHLSV